MPARARAHPTALIPNTGTRGGRDASRPWIGAREAEHQRGRGLAVPPRPIRQRRTATTQGARRSLSRRPRLALALPAHGAPPSSASCSGEAWLARSGISRSRRGSVEDSLLGIPKGLWQGSTEQGLVLSLPPPSSSSLIVPDKTAVSEKMKSLQIPSVGCPPPNCNLTLAAFLRCAQPSSSLSASLHKV